MEGNRLEVIKKYLKNDNIDIETLKTLTNEENIKNILRNLLNIEREYLVYCDIKNSPPEYKVFDSIKTLIMAAKDSEEIVDFTPYIGKIRKLKTNLKVIEKKLTEKNLHSFEWEEFIKKIEYDINIFEIEFMSKAQDQYKNNNYEFLSYIIYEIKNKTHLKQVLAMSPHYINTKNEDKKHIVIDLIEKFIIEIKVSNKNNINSVLYFESVIEEFITNPRFRVTDEDKEYLTNLIATTKDYIEENHGTINKYSQKLVCLKDLEDRLCSNSITREKIEKLNFKYNISSGFSPNIKHEIANIEVTPNNRIITIDSEKTLDMDDAVSIDKKDGVYKLNVYISDVASAIKEGTYLDVEAKRRYSTIYLSDNIIPMLPFELSNNILSLNSNSYKNVIVYEMYIDEKGKILKSDIIKRQVLISNKLSYNDVNNIIVTGKYNNKDIENTILYLSELATILKNNNTKKDGYREIEDLFNVISGIPKQESNNKEKSMAEVIIEEIMILTNMITALTFNEKSLPFIYRVHPNIKDTKDYESLKTLQSIVNNKYYQSNTNNYLKMIETLIKSYPKAYYSTENIGHFGIDVDYYSHSTSPIRRYSDLVIQRLIHDFILDTPTDEKFIYWDDKLGDICSHMNNQSEINYSYQCEYEKLKKLVRKGDK